MRLALLGMLAMPLVVASSPAAAGEPYYFHKPGVDRATYVADATFCLELAGGVEAPGTPYVYTPNLYAAAFVGLLGGIMNSRTQRAHSQQVERTCMADRGYARITIDKASLKRVRNLEGEARMDAMFELAAAPVPHGKELPE
jgi:hypothetical protein